MMKRRALSASMRLLFWTTIALLAIPLTFVAQTPRTPSAGAWFADVTARAGLRFTHDAGPSGTYFMPQMVGSGGAILDFDNDGRLDIYLVQNAPPAAHVINRLYRQQPDGTFRDVSAGSGLDVAGYGMGVAVGDVNNDGWPDILLTEYGRLRLFQNGGNGTFTDVTKAAGLDNPLWGTSAGFFDYDRDGWLDLVVVNYVDYKPQTVCSDNAGKRDFCGPDNFSGSVSRLFHNLGGRASRSGAPRFEDATVRSGIGRRKGPGLGVVCADFNGDHWPDILVANDGAPNFLWINHHDGTFTEEAVVRGIAYDAMGRPQANMGIAVGDVNGDGLFDIFITHLTTERHIAWMQGPAGYFQDRTGALGLATPKWNSTGFGTLFADFDQDGALDLALANGKVRRVDPVPGKTLPADFWASYVERNQLFANDGAGRFRDISEENRTFSEPAGVSRGLAMADFDGDGALDLLVTRTAASARLLRNVAPSRGHWLKIRAVDPALGGRDAYGAEITVRAGARSWKRLANPGFSYLTSSAPEVHVGLGSVSRVDGIAVVWPDGSDEQFPGGPVDRALVLKKGGSKSR